MTDKPDLLSLAARFAQLPDAQRSVFVERLGAAGIDVRMLPIPPRAECAARVSASFAQTRLWLHATMIDAPAAYHVTERMRIDGELDAHALRLACDALIARHEALRTGFVESAGGVDQIVHAPLRCRWRTTDLSAQPDAAHEPREARATEIALADELAPFDLAAPPLVRAHLIRLDARTHWFTLTMHHIVSDGWSIGVAFGELAAFYRAYRRQDPVAPAPLPIQYADFALWQRRLLDAGERERQLAYWRRTLDFSRGVIALPGARARPAARSARGGRHRFALDAPLAQRIRAFAHTHRVTPFAVLLASLAALLARASGERVVHVGVPAANRERAEVAGLVGFFVNTLTIAAQTDPAASFAALVDATHAALVDAQAHQDVPFDQVVDALGVERSASHHPLFQVMAAYDAQRAPPALDALTVTELPSGEPHAKVDLTLHIAERGEGDGALDAALVYACDLFDADAVDRIAARFVTLMSNALADPLRPLGDIAWLPAAERAQLDAWNRSPADTVPFRAVHERIAGHARARPDARGIADVERAYTRGEAEHRAKRLAQRLVAAGVRAETRVGVAMPRTVDLPVALIAVLKSGGAFVPLDPEHPRERLAQIVADAGIRHVLTAKASAAALPDLGGLSLWHVDDTHLYQDDETSCIALPDVVPEQAAYVIYTSGSTGKPKGVVVAHGAFARHCAAIAARYGVTERDVFLLFQSVNFDGAHEGWFSQYMSGAALALTADVLWPPAKTCAMIARERVTMTYAPPGCAAQLAEWALAHGAPPTLRSLTVGGEATSREAFATLRRAFSSARIVNGYGPTETVITPTLWMFEPGDDPAKLGDAAYLPIGTLVGARTAHVLDARLEPLPVGVTGELYLGGEGIGLARGYLDRPALTAERFVPDPYGAPGARLYRTGDLVRRRPDGVFDFIGRVDHQVKLRGLRIELGEIEAQLAAHAQVREAVALVRGEGARASLVAYVELSADAHRHGAHRPDSAELDAHLRRTLPDYMVPAQIVVLDALPRNANSKVDRAALPAPGRVERAYAKPRPGIETALARIWRDVLGIARLGRADHFFEQGGDSLAAVRVASRVAERLARDVPVRALFEAPVLAQYALRVVAARAVEHGGRTAAACAPTPDAHGVLPLSAAQLGLWFLWRAQPDSAAYNIPVALRMRGPLDVDALRAAFDEAAACHPALRTRLVERAGQLPGQRVLSTVSVVLPIFDLAAIGNEDERLAQAAALTDADALAAFDLAADAPLWRARILRLAATDHVLSLVVHHIVSDGRSIDLWLDDVRAAYVAHVFGRPRTARATAGDVPVLPAATPLEPERLAFWQDALASAPTWVLPAPTSGRAPQPCWRAGRIAFALPDALASRARDAALSARATLPMLLHAALNAALYRLTGVSDQPVGVLASTRELAGDAARHALGLFVNAVVVRTRIGADATPATVLDAVRDGALAAYAHADVPFADVVAALRAPRAGFGNPLFSVMFNYLRPADLGARDWAGLALNAFGDARHRVVFELELDIVEHPDGRVTGAFSYAAERVDGAFVAALASGYVDEVSGFVDASDVPIGVAAPRFDSSSPVHEKDDEQSTIAEGDTDVQDVEAALSSIWRDTFDGARIAPGDDLFEAGATSFDVVRFVDAASARGHALSIADVFAAPTLSALARRLSATHTQEDGDACRT